MVALLRQVRWWIVRHGGDLPGWSQQVSRLNECLRGLGVPIPEAPWPTVHYGMDDADRLAREIDALKREIARLRGEIPPFG